MRLPLTSALLLAALSCTPSCFAVAPEASGISLSQFRIIYPGADTKGVTWSLTNNTDRAWLIQSWMRPVDFITGLPMPETESSASSAKIPFLVTPPLKRVDAGEGMTLRIRLTELSLPKDRESVFYLSVKAIPAITDSDSASNGKLVVAVVNNIKLFYRPEGLPAGGVKKAAAQLRFSRQGESLVVDNPTPFYINFSQVTVGGKPISADGLRKLVPPYGQQRYDLVKGMSGPVEWQVLDEDHRPTPLQHQAL